MSRAPVVYSFESELIEDSVGACERDEVAVWEVRVQDEGEVSCSVTHISGVPGMMTSSRLTCMASHASDSETLLIAGENLHLVRCVLPQATFKPIFSECAMR